MVHHDHPVRRREDMSKFFAFARIIERFQGIAILLGAVLLALGFGWKTPGQKFAEEDRRIVNLEAKQDSLRTQHSDMIYYMRIIAVAVCQKQEATSSCQELLRERERFNR